jgi:predicted transcriptional regulator
MKFEIELHPIQSKILKDLSILSVARFSDLNTAQVPTDQFSFHIKRLINLDLVTKNEQGQYELTVVGKEFIGRLDPILLSVEKQAKICVALLCTKKDQNGEVLYLVHHRLREPFFNTFGPIIRKIKWGESSSEAAERVLFEFSGLKGTFTTSGVVHKSDRLVEGGPIVQDTFLYFCTCENPVGELIEDIGEGRNLWMTRDEFLELERNFECIEEILEKVDTKQHWILEINDITKLF